MESEVFERIREYLADQLDVDPEKITPDSDIVEDFGADSLDVVDMITTLSDEFGVDIPDEEIENFHTVGDVVQYVEDRI
ncbi:acyl carrier protein [Subdoligranulum sp. DSM 109015]|uniref:Acyl carrier protein n=1 Tax=Gemmiger gallinarum TaxID=2779354 RepID=A0ABR9R5N4_9FIRM|nr:acyl carrier protein [Gemmiger gallinarum]MBE5038355.1 acyl carrier protein [Gemmiger gallinarum]HIX17464.1 acyl carrier protein [Candidatus Gemmiger faecavium]